VKLVVKKILYADPLECCGCRNCEIACSVAKEGIMNPHKSRIRVVREGPVIDMPIACRQCADPPCAKPCPTNALVKENDLVVLYEENCIGCGLCVEECPFGAIFIHPDKGTAIKCDQCGECLDFCPTGALKLVSTEAVAHEKRIDLAQTRVKVIEEWLLNSKDMAEK